MRGGCSSTLRRGPPTIWIPPSTTSSRDLIAGGILIVLAVNGPPGHWPAVAYLNEQLQDAALAHDLGRIKAAFSEALELSSALPQSFKPITHFRDADALDAH